MLCAIRVETEVDHGGVWFSERDFIVVVIIIIIIFVLVEFPPEKQKIIIMETFAASIHRVVSPRPTSHLTAPAAQTYQHSEEIHSMLTI